MFFCLNVINNESRSSFVKHPSFDFSGAEFNGMVPSAREFMGGVKRS